MMKKSAEIRDEITVAQASCKPAEIIQLRLLLDIRDVLIQLAVAGRGVKKDEA